MMHKYGACYYKQNSHKWLAIWNCYRYKNSLTLMRPPSRSTKHNKAYRSQTLSKMLKEKQHKITMLIYEDKILAK